MSATTERMEPQRGQVWRERRRAYAKRTVLVDSVTPRFVYTDTLTLDNGRAPEVPRRNRVRRDLWHASWVWEPKAGDFV
jgi:hypothetical protein